MKTKINKKQKWLILSMLLIFAVSPLVPAQEVYRDRPYHNLENMQDTIEDKFVKIYRILENYPTFDYKYEYSADTVKDVAIYGVEDEKDKEDIRKLMTDMKKLRDTMANRPTRTGVYYSVDVPAEPQIGMDEFYTELQDEIRYPEGPENAGVEGIIFVKFLVDKNGNIIYATADNDIDSPFKNHIKALEEEAVRAFQNVDTKWEPAKVDGKPVTSYAVIPVQFDFEANPTIKAVIR